MSVHTIAATIQPEDPVYVGNEMMTSDLLIPVVISDGVLEPGVECDVTVHTENGTAVGKLLNCSSNRVSLLYNTYY